MFVNAQLNTNMSFAGATAAAMTASVSKLTTALQAVVVKPVSMTLILGLFTLALLGTTTAEEVLPTTWESPPAMATFTSYEDMQRYFDHRNLRSLRHIENPLKDSYLEAYNQHNEQEDHITKRSAAEQQELKQQPALIRFEMSDAVEPSDEVKELIRQYRSRQLEQHEKYMETVPHSNAKDSEGLNKAIIKRTPTNEISKQRIFGKRLSRSKRAMSHQQPANFKVQYIPFEMTDAREPDAHTKNLIKRMRALESVKLSKELPVFNHSAAADHIQDIVSTTTRKPFTKRPKFIKQWKPKRIRREAAAPEMIKFEIADAKDPDPSLKTFMTTKQTRETKDLKVVDTSAAKPARAADPATSDQTAQATKRYFVYKEAPTKIKKSIAAIPHDVQNIISHLIKGGGDGGGGNGKAYLKYIPAQQMDYNNLKASHPIAKGGYAAYGHGGGGGYGKYAHAVPVKFVYHPVAVAAAAGHGGGYEGGGRGALGHASGGEAGYGGSEGGHGSGYAVGGGHYGTGAVDVKYVAAVAGEGGGDSGGHASNYASDEAGGEGNVYGGGKGGVGGAYAADHGYAAAGASGSHGAGYSAAGGHGGGYGFVHADYGAIKGHAGGGGGYIAAHAPEAIIHPIVVAESGGGQIKAADYGAGHGEATAEKSAGNEAIKSIPAPQFKGETKYSVIPTVEQYAKTPTQEFQLKLYSPESLIAKAQLEAKDQAKAIAEEGAKAVAAAYKLAAGKGAAGYEGAEDEFGYKIGGGAKGGGGYGEEYVGYGGAKAAAGFGKGGAGPVIKIEYHAPAESFKGNYKDIPEFHQLSTLVGKSPEDQIHGLTYLLAKEMQNRLHLQRQHNFEGSLGGGKGEGGFGVGKGASGGVYGEGVEALPQENKSPVLFHPEEPAAAEGGGAGEGGKGGAGRGGGFYQPIVGKFIGMAKSKQYIPVIEQAAVEELKGVDAKDGFGAKSAAGGGGIGGKLAGHSYGLSPNYKGLAGLKGFSGGSEAVFNSNGYEEAAAKLQSYASKYAFGYRIRDFNTGNDFGHKQNRDLHGVTRGQYHILLPDGRIQNVIYHADDTGFHADVSFESGR